MILTVLATSGIQIIVKTLLMSIFSVLCVRILSRNYKCL
jgi:uncharacterized transporter YbjL